MKASILLPLLTCTLITGCIPVGPNYKRPDSQVPADWKWNCDDTKDFTSEKVEDWWEIFHDPVLNDLEARALVANQSLHKAVAAVVEARAQALIADSARYPHLNFNPSFANVDSLLFLFGIPPIFGKPYQRFHQGQYMLPITLSYEADIWGKLLRTYWEAEKQVQASVEAYNTIMLTMTSDLASDYFALRTIDAQQEVLDATIKSWEQQLTITTNRQVNGLVSELDVAAVEVGLENARAASLTNQRERALREDAIAVLVGVPASEFSIDYNPLVETPPTIPLGMPSELLLRRPDIAQAERNMAAIHEQIGIAFADYFPSINLSVSTGYSSPVMSFLTENKTRYFANTIDISQRLYDAGATSAEVLASLARYEQALADYQQTVLVGFQEAEDALAGLNWEIQSHEVYLKSQTAANKTLTLSQNRYLQGLANYLDVIIAEVAYRQAQGNAVATLGQLYASTVGLIKALGGGWDDPSPECDD